MKYYTNLHHIKYNSFLFISRTICFLISTCLAICRAFNEAILLSVRHETKLKPFTLFECLHFHSVNHVMYTLGDSVAYEVDESQLGETEAKHDMVCNMSDFGKRTITPPSSTRPGFKPITSGS